MQFTSKKGEVNLYDPHFTYIIENLREVFKSKEVGMGNFFPLLMVQILSKNVHLKDHLVPLSTLS